MMADPSDNESARTRKRHAVKSPIRAGAGAANKVKCTFHLAPEESRRLTVHAAYLDLDRSELIARLINDHLRRYVVSDRGGPAEGPAEAG